MDVAGPPGAPVSRGTNQKPRWSIGWASWPLLLFAALLVVLIGAGVPLGLKWNQARDEQQVYDDVLTAARAEALAFTTLNHETVDADIAKVLAGSTGPFKKQFDASKEQVKELTTEAESVSRGEVLSAGLVGSDKDSATVIVVADSTVTNVNIDAPQPRHYRIQMELVLVEDRWLTSELQFVG